MYPNLSHQIDEITAELDEVQLEVKRPSTSEIEHSFKTIYRALITTENVSKEGFNFFTNLQNLIAKK